MAIINRIEESSSQKNEVSFYGKDWKRSRLFAFTSKSLYFDVMVNDQCLYLIEMPDYAGDVFGLVFGLIAGAFLFGSTGALGGLIVGLLIGNSIDVKKREKFRLTWVGSNHRILSKNYEKNIFLKIPLENLKGHLLIDKKRLILNYDKKEITLQRYQKELDIFKNAIKI